MAGTNAPELKIHTADVARASATADAAEAEQYAINIKELSGAAYLYLSMAPLLGTQLQVPTFKCYLDALMKEAGGPTDPVERMMVEQLALAHHNLGRLHARAAGAAAAEEAKVYHDAAARLLGEFRRSALALEGYRQARSSRAASASAPRGRADAGDKTSGATTKVNGRKAPPPGLGPLAEIGPAVNGEVNGRGVPVTSPHTELVSNRLNGCCHDPAY